MLASTVTATEKALNKSLLPLEHDDVLELFGFLRLRDGDGLHWSKARTLRAALTKYHERLGVPSPFDEWSPRLRAFWRGLEKDCIQSGSGKEPIPCDSLVDYLMTLNETTDSPIAVRNAAMVLVGFFGERRGAEVVQFVVSDVVESSDVLVQLRVRCQKKRSSWTGPHLCHPSDQRDGSVFSSIGLKPAPCVRLLPSITNVSECPHHSTSGRLVFARFVAVSKRTASSLAQGRSPFRTTRW